MVVRVTTRGTGARVERERQHRGRERGIGHRARDNSSIGTLCAMMSFAHFFLFLFNSIDDLSTTPDSRNVSKMNTNCAAFTCVSYRVRRPALISHYFRKFRPCATAVL